MRLITLFLVGLLLVSCKKERHIHITAKNAVTGQPYAGLTYYVVQEMTSGDGEKFKTVATGTLDANGEASLTKKLPKAYSYAIRVEEPANTCYNKQITFYFGKEETFECSFEFAGCAYLNLNINNVNCQGGGDVMNFRSRNSYSEWEGWSTDRIGCYSVVSPYPFEVSAGWRIYEWRVNRNGVITTEMDSIFLNIGETGTFNMNY
jgi:hypothetical protein